MLHFPSEVLTLIHFVQELIINWLKIQKKNESQEEAE